MNGSDNIVNMLFPFWNEMLKMRSERWGRNVIENTEGPTDPAQMICPLGARRATMTSLDRKAWILMSAND